MRNKERMIKELNIDSFGLPRFSPDGTKILFCDSGGISTMNIDGSNVQILYGGDAQTDSGNVSRPKIQPIP